ncbi:MAG TPA: hypothetical protein VNB22_09715 [Pyrinomonadaceae bacterium]|nr:hypothetical protein [Pyrinomonadaceae bacterium]
MRKPLVKLSFPFFLILFFVISAPAQEDSPECAPAMRLHGVSLGMSSAEVQGVFGKDLKIKVKSSGDRSFFQNYIGKKAPAKLAGIRALYLRFLDDRLYQIEIFYEERADVPTLEAFIGNLSAQMKFPPNISWQFVKNKALIDCGAFTLVADKTLNPRVELTDSAKLSETNARRKKND